MAIKVIKKTPTQKVAATHTISTNKILASRGFAMRNATVFELIEPIKPIINIKIDAYGKPNIKTMNMGIQYEHYSS
jgi:hypothetical protein